MSLPFLVAEVSSNHGTSLKRCLRFVHRAAALGCDGVKFQQFRVRELFAPEALRAHPELLEREAWELPEEYNAEIAAYSRECGVAFASTPFYLGAVEVLEPCVDFFKLASYQILWHEMLREVAQTGKPVVLATGMATLDEVRAAVDVLGAAGCERPTLLHCVSDYPTAAGDANLSAIATLRRELGLPTGWSDHTVDLSVVLQAVQSFGADMVEFHFDLEGKGEEFAGGHCWLPEEVKSLVFELAIDERFRCWQGGGEKAPQECEAEERRWRTDPRDGLRPLVDTRVAMSPEAA